MHIQVDLIRIWSWMQMWTPGWGWHDMPGVEGHRVDPVIQGQCQCDRSLFCGYKTYSPQLLQFQKRTIQCKTALYFLFKYGLTRTCMISASYLLRITKAGWHMDFSKDVCAIENTLPETNSSHLKYAIPKGKHRLPTIQFSGANC